MANTDNPHGFTFYESEAGHAEFERDFCKASETFEAGDLLARDATGRIRIWTTSDSEVLGVSVSDVVAGSADDEVLFIKAKPGVKFEAQCSGTYAITLRDKAVDVEGTTGIMEVNEDSVANPVFTIRGEVRDGNNAIGANTRVYGEFNVV
jgi:hypothetical protein